jgi:hypothetical protein
MIGPPRPTFGRCLRSSRRRKRRGLLVGPGSLAERCPKRRRAAAVRRYCRRPRGRQLKTDVGELFGDRARQGVICMLAGAAIVPVGRGGIGRRRRRCTLALAPIAEARAPRHRCRAQARRSWPTPRPSPGALVEAYRVSTRKPGRFSISVRRAASRRRGTGVRVHHPSRAVRAIARGPGEILGRQPASAPDGGEGRLAARCGP